MTVFQFSIAQVFIIATLLVGKQINFMLSKDMGFKTEAIVSIFNPRSERELLKKERLAQKFKNIPEIATISIGDHPPASNSTNTTVITYNNGTNDIQTDLQLLAGDVNYIDVFEITLLAGRKRLSDTIKEIVINETALMKIYLAFKHTRFCHYAFIALYWLCLTKCYSLLQLISFTAQLSFAQLSAC